MNFARLFFALLFILLAFISFMLGNPPEHRDLQSVILFCTGIIIFFTTETKNKE